MALASRVSASAPVRAPATRASRKAVVVRAASAAAEAPDMNKRNTMNLILAGGIALPVGTIGYPYLAFFMPPR